MKNTADTTSKEASSVLITGGSGLIGRYLTNLLLSRGHKVCQLSRKPEQGKSVKVFHWDPDSKTIDPYAFDGIDCVVHLAGANIGEKRWTQSRKEEILKSRVESALYLYQIIKEKGVALKALVSASAVGYYGSVTSEKVFIEEDGPGTDFLGSTCKRWEDAVDLFEKSGVRTVKVRTAIVLERNDSALSKLMLPGKFGFLVKTGDGQQYMPWIHIADLCGIYMKAITDSSLSGSYNAVAPHHVTHSVFMNTLGKVMKRHVIKASVPSFVLKAVLGEMSDIVLKGSRISSEKIIKAGYVFRFDTLYNALQNVINNRQV